MFSLDLRSLALFRVLIGLILLFDLYERFGLGLFFINNNGGLHAHYTSFGLLPVVVSMEELHSASFSLHFASGTFGFQFVLFGLHSLFAMGLLIGFRTRLSSVACWLLTTSMHNRNVWINNGGDDLLRLSLFWAMFLPLDARYSLDRILTSTTTSTSTSEDEDRQDEEEELVDEDAVVDENVGIDEDKEEIVKDEINNNTVVDEDLVDDEDTEAEEEEPERQQQQQDRDTLHFSMASIGLMVQLCAMYWTSSMLKSGNEWRVDHSAMYYVLSIEQYTKPLGYVLLLSPSTLKLLTRATIFLQTYMPFFFFFPLKSDDLLSSSSQSRWRRFVGGLIGLTKNAAIFSLIAFHIGLLFFFFVVVVV